MSATPKNAVITLIGISGRRYAVSGYISDVAAALWTFSLSGLAAAASQAFLSMPERGVLHDISVITGTADTNIHEIQVNGVPLGLMVDKVVHVSSNPDRPKLNIKIDKGSTITIIQR